MFSEPSLSRAAALIVACRAAGFFVATAESCTGGLLAALITAIPGSSDVFERGFVTYSNAAKIESLGVASRILEQFGAVSSETARHDGDRSTLTLSGRHRAFDYRNSGAWRGDA